VYGLFNFFINNIIVNLMCLWRCGKKVWRCRSWRDNNYRPI